MSWFYRPYVSVAERQRQAQKKLAKLFKKGTAASPVHIEGRTIAGTFWGKSWCENLEAYSDFANRLPRGRTYVRNGSVVHLEITPGQVQAMVSGSDLYRVRIDFRPTANAKWKALCRECAGGIGSLIELLQGRFSESVMRILTRAETGLFPSPREIKMSCSCPDWATMCKHVAAVLYGIGARLDDQPELLFKLRSVNHEELIAQTDTVAGLAEAAAQPAEIAGADLSEIFGIEVDQAHAVSSQAPPAPAKRPSKPRRTPRPRQMSKKKRASAQSKRPPRAKRTRGSG